MTIQEKIAKEIQLIAELESSYPPYDNTVGRYHENNLEYGRHHTKIRDCYWRKRMLETKLEGGDLNATAEIY